MKTSYLRERESAPFFEPQLCSHFEAIVGAETTSILKTNNQSISLALCICSDERSG